MNQQKKVKEDKSFYTSKADKASVRPLTHKTDKNEIAASKSFLINPGKSQFRPFNSLVVL